MPPKKNRPIRLRQSLSLLLAMSLWTVLIPFSPRVNGKGSPKRLARVNAEELGAARKTADSLQSSASSAEKSKKQSQARINESYGRLPMSFELNKGQTDSHVKFLARTNGYNLFLTSQESVMVFNNARPAADHRQSQHRASTDPRTSEMSSVLRTRFVGSNPEPVITGLDALAGSSNYFIGNDSQKWQADLPNYRKVKYENIYPGIDLVYYGNQGRLEYDFVVAPGVNPNSIKLDFEGARKIRLDRNGDLVLSMKVGEVRHQKLFAYQEVDGQKHEVSASYKIKNNRQVSFQLGAYDLSKPLIIDPTLVYSTYLGGGNYFEFGLGIATDSSGNAYVTGYTGSLDFPTKNPYQASRQIGFDAFVTKLNPNGSALVYSTYLGGNDDDFAYGIAVDGAGNAYVTGYTKSTTFPTVNAFQSAKGGGRDIFVTKLNAAGSALVYSTYLGGSGDDGPDFTQFGLLGPPGKAGGIAVDAAGNANVTGFTASTNFPTVNALQSTLAGGRDVFVTKFSSTGTTVIYSTYLGGVNDDFGRGIAVDSSGSAYLTGNTFSPDFPTVNAFQPTLVSAQGSLRDDAFVTKLNPSGTAFVYSTFLGGSNFDQGIAIAVDGSGNAYITGGASSPEFPIYNAFQPTQNSAVHGFLTKLNATGSGLVYSTFLGGDGGLAIAVDSSENVYVAGDTSSPSFPTANPLQSTFGGGPYDAFITKINSNGDALVYSTYLGGNSYEHGWGVAVDPFGSAYVTGYTQSGNFPTHNAFQPTLNNGLSGGGGGDAFLVKIYDGSGFTIAGHIADAGANNLSGVTVSLSGSQSASTQTDASGDYNFIGLAASGTFTVTPSLSPYTFSPTNQTFTNLAANQTANFTGTLPPITISGRVTDIASTGISSVTMTLNGSQTGTAATNSTGNYSFTNLPGGGTYTVTPSKTGLTFDPVNQTFTNAVTNQTANFFQVYSISGRVTDSSSVAMPNATLTLSGSRTGTTLSDANGNYSFAALPAKGSYTVTPFKDDPLLTYTSSPVNLSYTSLTSNQTAANFMMTAASTSTLYPIADAYVQDGTAANTNFGTANPLLLQTNNTLNVGKNRDVYFTFDLSGVTRSISSVKLRIYAAVSASGSVGTSAYSVANTGWIESGTGSITWNNKPARSSTALTGATATVTTTAFTKYDIDVTSYVKSEKAAGRNIVSLALHDASSTTLNLLVNSRESATNKPQLFITTSNNDNLPPTVNLTAPANGAIYAAPANVTLTATAADTDGSISKVDFYAGTALIGTSTASPYTFNWPNVEAGNYSLTAVATDNSGATTASAPANITVNVPNSPPAVSLLTPYSGTTYSAGSNLTLSANASDTDGTISKVDFYAGATLIGTATIPGANGVYSFAWNNVPSGAHALTAKATDNAGAVTTSTAVNINVISQTGLLPTADAYVRDGTFAGTNFGLATELQVQTSATAGSNRESYLKFDTTTISGVTKAKIRLFGKLSDTSGANVPVAIYSVASTSWSETTVKWSAKLVSGTTALDTVVVTDNNPRWYEWDVTSYVQSEKAAGRPIVSFALKATQQSIPYVTFSSREATGDRPQMILQNTGARTALFVAASTTLNTSETALKTRLTNLGFTVTVITGKNATTTSANGKTIVVISSTVLPTDVNTKFRNAPVPVATWEADIFDDLGMTGSVSGTDFGTATTQTQLAITNPSHPLAAGLSGTITVTSAAATFAWGKPNANAINVASLTSDATKIVIFSYEKDASMPVLDAPARRVGFFLSDTTGVSLNSNGNSLFDAAIKWATELITGANITSLLPASGPIGTAVTITGQNFGAVQDGSTITFNGVEASPTSWSATSISATVPPYATTGPVVVTVGGVSSNAVTFTVGDVDSDGDGLPDWWEMLYFGNLNQGANDDPDGDVITNLQEYQQGRNPTKSALADDGDFVNLKVHTPLRP
jgi:hypothetical protein